jgi:hypothetical protein
MGTIWELDFYSRPILDEQQKKQWEVLICESPQSPRKLPESLFRYSQFCPSSTVNSVWLKEAIQAAIAESGGGWPKSLFIVPIGSRGWRNRSP